MFNGYGDNQHSPHFDPADDSGLRGGLVETQGIQCGIPLPPSTSQWRNGKHPGVPTRQLYDAERYPRQVAATDANCQSADASLPEGRRSQPVRPHSRSNGSITALLDAHVGKSLSPESLTFTSPGGRNSTAPRASNGAASVASHASVASNFGGRYAEVSRGRREVSANSISDAIAEAAKHRSPDRGTLKRRRSTPRTVQMEPSSTPHHRAGAVEPGLALGAETGSIALRLEGNRHRPSVPGEFGWTSKVLRTADPGREGHHGDSGEGEDITAGHSLAQEHEAEEPTHDILAICTHGDILGVAAYREVENVIDIQQTHAFQSDMADTLAAIKLVVRPCLILAELTLATNPELFPIVIAPVVEGADNIEFRLVKRSSWDYQSSMRGICANLQVKSMGAPYSSGADMEASFTAERIGDLGGDEAGGDPHREAFNRLGSVIDFQAQQQIRALGALISHLQSTAFSLEASGSVTVSSVRQLDTSGYMRVDTMTLRSLSIMSEEFHPNIVSGKGRSKEGFSVYGLLDRTRSAAGRRCLKEWMLKPLYDVAAIRARQDGVEILMQVENAEIYRQLRGLLGKAHDVSRTLLRIKKVAATFVDWCRLIQAIEATLDIRDGLAILGTRAAAIAVADVDGANGHREFLDRLLGGIDAQELRQCLDLLVEVIDVQDCMDSREIMVRAGHDPRLDKLKDLWTALPDILREVARHVLDENPLLDELSVEYVPQIGFLVTLNQRFCDPAPPDLVFAFSQGDTVYFKNGRMHDMDDAIGDIQAQITDLQAAIVRNLEEEVLKREAPLLAAATVTAGLDAVMSLASVAADFGFVRPEMVTDNAIIIKNGRHPLQELTVERFIPNDTFIADGSRVALITGANCSGKSVYLKQVGVIVYLAHVGSFVPAEKAVIGLTDRIFTRIATVETSAVPQSAFTIDVNQVAHMIRSSTPRSLLLIDEFGKGTAPEDGIGLVGAVVRHLWRTGRNCLFTLHFHEIFSHGLVKVPGPNDMRTELDGVTVFRMEVQLPNTADKGGGLEAAVVSSGEWLIVPPLPIFKLTPGITTTSHGIACAEAAGIPDDVLSRAMEVVLLEEKGKPIQARDSCRAVREPTLAYPTVQEALKLFMTPESGLPWNEVTDDVLAGMKRSIELLGNMSA